MQRGDVFYCDPFVYKVTEVRASETGTTADCAQTTQTGTLLRHERFTLAQVLTWVDRREWIPSRQNSAYPY